MNNPALSKPRCKLSIKSTAASIAGVIAANPRGIKLRINPLMMTSS
jgi:hypothetical protein